MIELAVETSGEKLNIIYIPEEHNYPDGLEKLIKSIIENKNSENVNDADIKSISSIFTPKNTFELVNEEFNLI